MQIFIELRPLQKCSKFHFSRLQTAGISIAGDVFVAEHRQSTFWIFKNFWFPIKRKESASNPSLLFGRVPQVVRSTLLHLARGAGNETEMARRAGIAFRPARRVILLVVSGWSGRHGEPKQFIRFGRFFDHSSGSPNSNAMRRLKLIDNINIKAHAKFQINPLGWCREWNATRSWKIMVLEAVWKVKNFHVSDRFRGQIFGFLGSVAALPRNFNRWSGL